MLAPATCRAINIATRQKAPCLSPYQMEGIDFLVRDGVESIGRILGHDPGLGKTAQAILAGAGLGLQRVLILCPAAVIYQWAAECHRWAGFRPAVIMGTKEKLPAAGWVICAYSRVKSLAEFSGRWDAVICDEFHYLKDPKSQRTRAVWGQGPKKPGIRHFTDRLWLLSGTPIPNRCRELTHIVCWLRPKWFPSANAFLRRYCWSGMRFYYGVAQEEFDGASNSDELRHKLIASKLLHRVRKQDVLAELPAKRRSTVPLAIQPHKLLELTRKINDIMPLQRQNEVLDALRGSKALPDFDSFSRVRALIGEAKAAAAAEWLVEEAREGKTVVFTYHVQVGRIVQTVLQELGIAAWFVCGEQAPAERQKAIAEFAAHKGHGIFIGTLGSCGTGLNGLQDASARAVFIEASYVPGHNTQAEDRLHRIGQKNAVLIQYLYAPVALDDHLTAIVAEKSAQITAILG